MNELGVAEPVIQQQGSDRIVVELPGVQDTAKAKDIIGRTATLEARLADPTNTHPDPNDPVPPGDELFTQGNPAPVLLRKQVIFTGDRIIDASAGFDEHQRPSVNIRLDAAGGRAVSSVSRDNIGKPMAMVLFEKGKGEVLTVATIQSELGDRFQITGQPTPQAATDLALLLRAGSLAAPMDIIEERTIGPSLGADNIRKGFDSVQYGFAAIAVFMIAYYMLFGLISMLSLSVNLLLLVAILSMLQATLTLPGIAAIALALGMAIDANVLINERIREELRNGAPPQTRDPERLLARLGDDSRLERHHADRRSRAARVRLRPGARLRGRALYRHPDVDVLGRVLLARSREPLVRRQEEAAVARDRPGVASGRRRRRSGDGGLSRDAARRRIRRRRNRPARRRAKAKAPVPRTSAPSQAAPARTGKPVGAPPLGSGRRPKETGLVPLSPGE